MARQMLTSAVMKRTSPVVVLFAVASMTVVALAGCDDEQAASADGGVATPDENGCCKPDPSPGCCMNYGGAGLEGQCSGRSCDGMPVPSDPGWHLATDAQGCRRWTNPNDRYNGGEYSASTQYCGAPIRRDAGEEKDAEVADGSAPDASDAARD